MDVVLYSILAELREWLNGQIKYHEEIGSIDLEAYILMRDKLDWELNNYGIEL